MSFKEKYKSFAERHLSVQNLLPFVLTLVIVWLLIATSGFWLGVLDKLGNILKPFIIGFIIAYVLRPVVIFFEKYGVKRVFSIPIVIVVVILLLTLLFASIIPNLYDDLSKFFATIPDGLQQVYRFYLEFSNNNPSPIINDIFDQVMSMVQGAIASLTTLPSLASSVITSIMSALTTTLFSFIIGMYFIFDYERFVAGVHKLVSMVSPKISVSLTAIDGSVSSYLKTLIIIMLITAVEYGLIYTLAGHSYALVLGVLTALSLLIPYVGPMIVHTIGILTALSLPMGNIIFLIVALVVFSNIDGYVISPMVYSKRNRVEPLWSLFSLFACNVLFGFVGVLLSMPIYFSIRAVFTLRDNNWVLPEEK